MTGAIEFLRKAKAICKSNPQCKNCELIKYCGDFGSMPEASIVVRKVMDYQIKEVAK